MSKENETFPLSVSVNRFATQPLHHILSFFFQWTALNDIDLPWTCPLIEKKIFNPQTDYDRLKT